MSTRATGSRTPEQVEKHVQRTHKILSMSPKKLKEFVDGKVTDPDSIRAMFTLVLRLIKANANTDRN